jgi:predicted nucleic acid-binding protein
MRLVAHTLAETFSTLTTRRYGLSASTVTEYLSQYLATPPIGIQPEDYPAAIEELARVGVAGASVYDGLIALAAKRGGATLISLNSRARRTYEKVGVDFQLLLDQ